MRYSYKLSIQAEDDLLEGFSWYEMQKSGLGEQFLQCIERSLIAITKNPLTYNIRYKKIVRAYIVQKFPYLILYILENTDINIIAVFNTNRNPATWKKRI
ncbi:type II toxin-antitoxin system RelE/ParE family toxin [Pedobacter glucosidilyticus]|uniref:type II toxin-antitoxin system RelE/ParE family toxin n=1 Tax=Pedobacter glucosidilyticus TaxID=1122941 RepID=UPI0026ED0F0A|nr:type II toxin-antitoxin system RelE/ParE family toxin [Pedobacter glucosidilyticus]